MKSCMFSLALGLVLGAAGAMLLERKKESCCAAAQTARILEDAANALRNP